MYVSILIFCAGAAFLALAGVLAYDAWSTGERGSPASVLRSAVDSAVARLVLDFERDPVLSAAVPVILFMVLPGAALLNAALGGSPFLLICYLSIAASVFVHMALVERPAFRFICAFLSGVGAVLALVALPYYAVWSLTLHIMTGSPAEGALMGMLIATILYAANAGVWMLAYSASPRPALGGGARFVAAVLAVLPVGYAVYWFCLLGVGVAGADGAAFRGWGALIGFALAFAGCAALLKFVLDVGLQARLKSGRGRLTAVWASAGLGVLAMLAGYAVL